MPVNKEELVTDLNNPEYLTLVKETLSKKEFTIQDKTEHEQYLERVKNDVLEKELPNKIKSVHDQYDKDFKELYGIERDPNEKSYDYGKRAASLAMKASADKIKELETAIASGKGSEAILKKLEAEEAKFKSALRDRDNKIQELERQTQTTAKAADVKLVYGEIKKNFVKQLPPLFDRVEKAVIEDAVANSVMKDGKLLMTNPDGTVRKDGRFNEITVEDYLKAEFKDVIEKKKEQGGAGSSGNNNPDPSIDPKTMTPDNFPMKESIKRKTELTDYMVSLGLKQGTKEFQAIWTKFGVPLTEM